MIHPKQLGNPLEWTPTKRVLFGSLVILPFALWGIFVERHILAGAPFVDQRVLAAATKIQIGLSVAWALMALVTLVAPPRPRVGRVLTHAYALLYFVTVAQGSYLTGFFTSLFSGVTFIAGVTVALVLFDRGLALPSIVLFIVFPLAVTGAEWAGVIPYAPLLTAAPFSNGRLSPEWLLGYGATTFAAYLGVIAVIYWVVERWRDREEQLARANEFISRYVAAQVAEEIRAGKYSTIDRRERRKLTLFFSDIKGFSDAADRMEPEDLSRVLEEYLGEMTALAGQYGATVDKFMGDGIAIFFGAPAMMDDGNQALQAVRLGIAMQARMVELRDKWRREGVEEPFEIRIGINTGVASVGSFGAKGRMDYTAIGRQVNLAARLQAKCTPGSVLISHSTWALVQDQLDCRPCGELQIKGFHHPVKIYEALCAPAARAEAVP
jgi:class 3 adenylate cyclase